MPSLSLRAFAAVDLPDPALPEMEMIIKIMRRVSQARQWFTQRVKAGKMIAYQNKIPKRMTIMVVLSGFDPEIPKINLSLFLLFIFIYFF